MKIQTTILLTLATAATVAAQVTDFKTLTPTDCQISFPNGVKTAYKAYERVWYVSNISDTNSQCLSIFVPENAKPDSPILLKTYTTDFHSTSPQKPSETDETGLALQNGFVVCIAGSRGYNSMKINTYTVEDNNKKKKKKKKKQEVTVNTDVTYCGKLPAPLIDLKAAVRYLRANDASIPGNSEKIIATGSMAGGGLAALLGATADNPIYNQQLDEAGAPKTSDKIMAVACFCPLTEPLTAARSGEWLLDNKGDFPRYIDTLALLIPETEIPLTSNTYRNYLKDIAFDSAREALDNGEEISDDLGPVYFSDSGDRDFSQYIINFNLDTYLNALKAVTYKNGYRHYYTTLAAKTYGEKTTSDYALSVKQMNLTANLLAPKQSATTKWYIRHGMLDASVPITESITLAAMLSNMGFDINFDTPWSTNYNYNELVEWIKGL